MFTTIYLCDFITISPTHVGVFTTVLRIKKLYIYIYIIYINKNNERSSLIKGDVRKNE